MARRGFICCLAAAVLVATSIFAAAASAAPPVVADKLFDPRGIAAGPGDRLLVAQAGSGEITRIRDADEDDSDVSVFAQLAPGGPADVVAGGFSTAYVTMGGAPEAAGDPFGQLLRVRRGGGSSLLADIAGYQVGDPDPDDQADPPFPEESNAFGMARLWGGRFLVADAANNDLLLITTAARSRRSRASSPRRSRGPRGSTSVPLPGPRSRPKQYRPRWPWGPTAPGTSPS